ncbi:hypothetical protein QBC43DRAFT_326727 [Cladorrhinum sp. PSN259]|nr:hypothetical protein QBC43DRAFT_326727 [Cladorrhinum sp. PSN259]
MQDAGITGIESLDPYRRCYCGKVYQTLASLMRHSRTCPALTEDCKAVLCVLSCLEPRPVPADLLYRALRPFRTWNENGNESRDRLAGSEPVFSTFERLDRAVQVACAIPAVQPTDSAIVPDTDGYPWWADRDLAIEAQCRIFIHNELIQRDQEQLLRWRLETLRVVLHAFPHQDLDTQFIERGQAFFPFVLPALREIPAEALHPREIERAVYVCVAGTAFGSPSVKRAALEVAQSLVHRVAPSPLAQSIQVRQMQLCLLNSQPIPSSFFPGPGRKGNAQLAEYLLVKAQRSAEEGQISQSWQFIGQWAPAYAAQPSLLESIMSFRIDLMKGKLSRYQGEFSQSRLYLEPLATQYPAPQAQFLCRLHLVSVYGELALWDKGRTLLAETVATADSRKRLLQLSLAEFHLARGLDGSDEELAAAERLFLGLFDSYEKVALPRRAAKRNFARVCLGLAIVSHMQRRGRSHFSLLRALNDWRLAYDACLESAIQGTEPGFPALICLLSLAEIKASLEDTTLAQDLHRAREIWGELGRRECNQRFYFANIGTRWADLVSNWLETAGIPQVLPRWGAGG